MSYASSSSYTYIWTVEKILYGNRLKINSVGPTDRSVGNTAADRALSPWLGGSIVGSLGSFHELWVSRKEYQECGASIVDRK